MAQENLGGQRPRQGSSYLAEMKDGFLVRVPEDKLESWQRADHDAPLTPGEERLIDRILDEIYGSRR